MDFLILKSKRHMHFTGGYCEVIVNETKNKVTKSTNLYTSSTSSETLSFNPFVDAIISNAISHIQGTPDIDDIYVGERDLYMEMPYLGESTYSLSARRRKLAMLDVLQSVSWTCLRMADIGLQHTDIKHANVLVAKNGLVTLIDYNICSVRIANEQYVWSPNVGTWECSSPEIVLLNIPSDTSMVWSLAILMCFMLTGVHPLNDWFVERRIKRESHKSWVKLLNMIEHDNPIGLPLSKDAIKILPDELRALFHECTYWDPIRRISITEFYERITRYMSQVKNRLKRKFVEMPIFSFKMIPSKLECRDIDFNLMKEWCKETNQMYLLCRSISMYDRISWDPCTLDAPTCIAISYMLTGNDINRNDDNIKKMIYMFAICDWTEFIQYIIEFCHRFDWKLYECPTDVYLMSYIDRMACNVQSLITCIFYEQLRMDRAYYANDIVEKVKRRWHLKE